MPTGSSNPSKLGIAREYQIMLREHPKPAVAELKRARELAKWIAGGLELPGQVVANPTVLTSEAT